MSYYSQLALANEFAESVDPTVNGCIAELLSSISKSDEEHRMNLLVATELAQKFAIHLASRDDSPDGYDNWRVNYVEQFERQFPMSRIEHYYFFYGRKLSEISCSVSLACALMKLKDPLAPVVDVAYKIEKCVKDCEFTLFRLTAAAALLSSEPRHGAFSVSFRVISKAFEPFKNISVSSMNKNELNELCTKLDTFCKLVDEQFGKCVDVLTDLGV
jgi:hypothetical protein